MSEDMKTNPTNIKKSDEEFMQQAGELLRERANNLDAATRSKLNQARQRALDELDRKQRRPKSIWLPVGAMAAMALLAAGLSLDLLKLGSNGQPVSVPAAQTEAQVPDLELMFAEESLEMMEEMDFYLWLEEDQSTSGVSYAADAVS